ncbi:molecular chaperone MKKS-like [Saccostrea echinata]|uniref:molecular chaperone MKKS-like n=1 Tax=Saccostrea echinata TaxID=191078 RepID=UPI002A7F15DB|nr:molecular chaperone MKKS-like [Saccostrea echinata]XP_061174039.1 molecular chaperone MKKS-like [Saccostrea echinata]XP_061174040.1 molecular chaperone MKKS-like [Saccostrea echinata]XP_061174041.1 molecular chaperone MKKS-like [Saccostrea echinata]
MSGRKSVKEESKVHHGELKDILEGIRLLKNIVQTSRGPYGKVKVIQNASGGHVTLTSSSGRLLPLLSISKPLLKLLVTSAEGHLQKFSDGGLSLMAWCLNIVESAENSVVNNRCLIELNDELMELALSVLNSDSFPGKVNLSLSNTVQILSLVKTILSSKPLCKLSDECLKHIASLIVECFLSSVKEDHKNANCIMILTSEGLSVDQSKYVPGILLLYPEISSSNIKTLHFNMIQDRRILVALVTASMSGDSEEVIQGQYHQNAEVNAQQTVIEYIKTFCNGIIGHKVGVIMCQRVIHPKIKSHLREKGIFLIERMGARISSFVQDLTGAIPIDSFSCDPKKNLGWLDAIDHVILNKKSYLHLQRADRGVNSLLLYGMEEEIVSELKLVCETALSSLQNILQYLILLCGGGCWETSLAFSIKQKMEEKRSSVLENTMCTSSALSAACEIFCNSLLQVAKSSGHPGVMMMTSFPTFHCWRVPLDSDEHCNLDNLTCSCGMVTEQMDNLMSVNDVKIDSHSSIKDAVLKNDISNLQQISQTKSCIVDSYISNVSALRNAVSTANMILNVGNCLQDIN